MTAHPYPTPTEPAQAEPVPPEPARPKHAPTGHVDHSGLPDTAEAATLDAPAGPPKPWAQQLANILGRHPRPLAEIVAALGRADPTVTADAVEAELHAWPAGHESADGWVNLLAVADGVVLTHVVTAQEIERGALYHDDDLGLWVRLADDGLPLAASAGLTRGGLTRGGLTRGGLTRGGLTPGGLLRARWAVHEPWDPGTELAGPPGWLDAVEPLSVIGLRLHDGRFEMEIVPREVLAQPDRTEIDQLLTLAVTEATRALREYLTDGDKRPRVRLDWLLGETLLRHSDLLRTPTLPLGHLLRIAGFECSHDLVGLPGTPRHLFGWEDLSPDETLGRIHGAAALLALGCRDDEVTVDTHRLFADLARPKVIGFAVARAEQSGLSADAMQRLGAAATTPADRAVAALLAARCELGCGRAESAERLVVEALADNPSLQPALFDAADFAATRGDIAAADTYLRRARAEPDYAVRVAYAELLSPVPSSVGRNNPCPCGSGRKHKLCCLAKQRHPLPARARLVYARLAAWMAQPAREELLDSFLDLVDVRIGPNAELALNLAMFDRLEQYLAERGPMLPADERELLQQWSGIPIAPYEVAQLHRGESLTLRPLLGGDPVTLRARTPGAAAAFVASPRDRVPSPSAHEAVLWAPLREGDAMVARLLPDGQEHRLFHLPVLVTLAARAALMEIFADYSPHRLAAFFGPESDSWPLSNPRNSDGQDLVLCKAEYEVTDSPGAWRRLIAVLGPAPDPDRPDRLEWVRDTTPWDHDPDDTHLGLVYCDGPLWTVETGSVERLRELTQIALTAAPDAVLRKEITKPVAELLRAQAQAQAGILGDAVDTDGGHAMAADGTAADGATDNRAWLPYRSATATLELPTLNLAHHLEAIQAALRDLSVSIVATRPSEPDANAAEQMLRQ